MRIIAGRFRGKRISPPSNLKARPTTDFAKEGLFNVLKNYIDFSEIRFLDVFAGTGNISYELFSRGASSGDCVDISLASQKFRKKMIDQLQLDMVSYKLDGIRFLRTCKKKYNLIFCDPPYSFKEYQKIPKLVFDKKLLIQNGMLVVEHPAEISFTKENNFVEQRTYGRVNFSIFQFRVLEDEEE